MLSVDSRAEIKTEKINSELPRQQKIAVVFLAFIGIGVIVIWSLQMNSQINKPFRVPKNTNKIIASSTDQSLIDSDGDGLTDSQEINTYKTSPYLEDSDSDGVSDKQEIVQGTDPNCPAGKNCNALEGAISSATSSGVVSSSSVNISDSSQVTPNILRQVLLESGQVSQADLDKISDEDLIAGYYEVLKTSQEEESGASSSNKTETNKQ